MLFSYLRSTATLFASVLVACAILMPSQRAALADGTLSDAQKTEIEQLIHEYLQENPEVLVDAIRAYRAKQEQAQQAQAQASVMDFKMLLAHGELNVPSHGPADAPVTIVEFFDYRCGYCKKVLPDVQALMETESDIRFVFMEFPILGEDSAIASQAALAVWVNWPDKYVSMHNALMGSRGGLNESKVMEAAAGLGIDTAALREAMASQTINQLIQTNYQLAESMNINGTPAFIIGDELVPGAIDMATMKHLIDAARKG